MFRQSSTNTVNIMLQHYAELSAKHGMSHDNLVRPCPCTSCIWSVTLPMSLYQLHMVTLPGGISLT